MTLDEAKRIVLEKYPSAKVVFDPRFYSWSLGNANHNLFKQCTTSKEAWLSAAHRIQKEKDK